MVVLMKTSGENDCCSNWIIRDLVIHTDPGNSLNLAAAHTVTYPTVKPFPSYFKCLFLSQLMDVGRRGDPVQD